MYVRKKYRLRHELLGVLLRKHDSYCKENSITSHKVSAEYVSILLPDLAKELNISVEELKSITPPLVRADEIEVRDFGNGVAVFAWNDSQTAYDEKKYLEIGRKKFNDDIYDVVKWLMPLALMFITIYTIVKNQGIAEDSKENTKRIEQIDKRLTTLEQSDSTEHRTKKGHDSVSSGKMIVSDSVKK